MQLKIILSMAAGIVCCSSVVAAEEFSFSTPEAWQKPELLEITGENAVTVTGQKMLVGKKLIKLPEGAELKISGTFRAPAGAEKNTMYLGFITYDANRREFQHVNIHPIAGTESVLTADAKKGDTFIMVADASKWQPVNTAVWGAKADLSDLPNYNILPKIDKVEKAGDAWKVSFKTVLKSDLAKDTGVRQHQPGGWMYYSFLSTVPGTDNPPRNTNKKIWPHVKFVRFLVLANWKGGKDAKLEMIDPKVTIILPAAQQ